jgi:hypothetical protein
MNTDLTSIYWILMPDTEETPGGPEVSPTILFGQRQRNPFGGYQICQARTP